MAEKDYGVVLFQSTQVAIKGERTLLLAGFTVKLIPTPRQFSSNCGTALRCAWSEVGAVTKALKAGKVEYESVHRLTAKK